MVMLAWTQDNNSNIEKIFAAEKITIVEMKKCG